MAETKKDGSALMGLGVLAVLGYAFWPFGDTVGEGPSLYRDLQAERKASEAQAQIDGPYTIVVHYVDGSMKVVGRGDLDQCAASRNAAVALMDSGTSRLQVECIRD
ncbi:hypothetical protein LOM8899_01380 [Flavimaricola marinus]|uniref:Uncharacterized protein n=1 Tax=Flavimaricola marinus TaxID=1819565 RepID=A0A238LBZ5_9RHOB|nr:hypothetical protein LOM8899_01380 [Flavimaricola marinus]